MVDNAEPPIPLTGKVLLQRLKDIGDKPRREAAKLCGYYKITRSGGIRVNLGSFYDAVVEANGIPLERENTVENRGRDPAFQVSVHQSGQIVIGAAYTKAMKLNPGDKFNIKLGYKHIHLYQVSEDGESSENGYHQDMDDSED